MKVDELMIGDWVKFSYSHHETGQPIERIFKVTEIEAQLGSYYVWSEEKGRMCHPERLVGIPITPEILEKNGFKHCYYGIYRQIIGESIRLDIFPEGFTVMINEKGTLSQSYRFPALGFVHKLQHALRLCGIEKEIEL